jgi:hypothetical protein
MINELDLATNPTTSSDILEQLAKSDRISIVSAIAANPNTPVSLLIQLAEHESVRVRQQIALNCNTPLEILPKFANDNENVRNGLRQNPHLQADLQAAKSSDTDLHSLAKLAQSPYTFIRREIAANPNSTANLLGQLSEDEDWEILTNVASHINTPLAALEMLAKREDEDWKIRWNVAENPNTPLATLEMLAKRDGDCIMSSLSKNPQLQPDIQEAESLDTKIERLIELSHSPYSFVREKIARNSNTPLAILEMLAKCEDDCIISFLSKNPQLKPDIQEAKNSNTKIERLIELSHSPYSFVCEEIARNRNTPLAILEMLAKRDGDRIMSSLSENPQLQPDIYEAESINTKIERLVELSHSPYSFVREKIAGNPHTPTEILVKFAESEHDSILILEVARHLNTPMETLSKIAVDWLDDDLSEIFDSLRDNPLLRSDLQAAENPNTNSDRLIELSRHKNPIIRQEVAKNKSTPVEILIELAGDPKFFVRREAAYHPEIPPSILIGILEEPGHTSHDLAEEIAGKTTTPAIVLRKLLENRDNWAELYQSCAACHYLEPEIARNPNTPLDILEQFVAEIEFRRVAGSDRISVCAVFIAGALAANPNTPVSLLIRLFDIIAQSANESDRISVIRAIAEHPNSNADLLEQLNIASSKLQK